MNESSQRAVSVAIRVDELRGEFPRGFSGRRREEQSSFQQVFFSLMPDSPQRCIASEPLVGEHATNRVERRVE